MPHRTPHRTPLRATAGSAAPARPIPPRPIPASLDNVERLPTLSARRLDHDHMRTGRPVILTDLFADAPVRRLADRSVARSRLGHLPLPVIPNPVESAVRGVDGPDPVVTTLADLHDRFEAGQARGLICAEHDLPDELADLVTLPQYHDIGDPRDFRVANMFMAGPGNATHLHFDRDLRHNLLYQVFGRKRYVIIDASQSRKLALGTAPGAPYASTLFLQNFSRSDLDAFIRYTDAWDCILEPGETLLVPATAWHYVEYLDTALSVHLRLLRNRYLRTLGDLAYDVGTCSVELQALAARCRDEAAVGPAEEVAVTTLRRATRGNQRPAARADRFDRVCAEWCARLRLPIAGAPYHRDAMLDLQPA